MTDKEMITTESLFEELFGTKAKVRTFIFLLSHPIYEYTIEDIKKYTGLTRQSILPALKKFKEYGIIVVTKKKKAKLYQINLTNPIVQAYNEMDKKITDALIEGRLVIE